MAEREFLGQLKINNEPVYYLVGKLPVVSINYLSVNFQDLHCSIDQNCSKYFNSKKIDLFQPLTKQSRSCLPLNKMLWFIALAWFPSPTDQQYHGYTVHRWRGQRHYRVDNVAQARVLKYKINQFIKISAISDFITNQKKCSGSLSS